MKRNRGFTLIELLTVIMIISLLVAVVIVALNKSRVRARDTKRKQDIQQVANALQLYYQDNRAYPPSASTVFEDFTTSLDDLASGTSTYLSSVPVDPYVSIDPTFFYSYCSGGDTYAARGLLEAPSSELKASATIGSADCTNTGVFKSGEYKSGDEGSEVYYTSVSSGN